ncbi:MAG: ribbon-helix-helix domain-containing protein [Desulfurococcales archaeon]|nr:ribbon-helix-helix domain-containing protein [Desulfurococcales archaeon]
METPQLQAERNKMMRVQGWVPADWTPCIMSFLKQKGYLSISELIRDILREKLADCIKEVEYNEQ